MREVICSYLFLLGGSQRDCTHLASESLRCPSTTSGSCRSRSRNRQREKMERPSSRTIARIKPIRYGSAERRTHAPAAFRINALDNPTFDEESRLALRRCEDVEIPSQGDVILTPRIRPAPLVHLLTNLNALAEILNLDAGGEDSERLLSRILKTAE